MAHGEKRKDRPVVGLALGSGSARGWAHIGVIQALEENGVEPDVISGCSIGALVGASYISGRLGPFRDWVEKLTWKEIVRYMDIKPLGGGVIQGDKLFGVIRKYVEDTKIESLQKRFGAVATDLDSGREIWLMDGDLLKAARASTALPGVFNPYSYNERWTLDGGLVNPVPVSLCRAMGAEIVIAVNLNGDIVGKHRRAGERKSKEEESARASVEAELWKKYAAQLKNDIQEKAEAWLAQFLGPEKEAPGLFETTAGAINIMQDRITRSRMAGDPPEVLLAPRLAHVALLEFDRAKEVIEEGRKCVARAMPMIKEVLGEE